MSDKDKNVANLSVEDDFEHDEQALSSEYDDHRNKYDEEDFEDDYEEEQHSFDPDFDPDGEVEFEDDDEDDESKDREYDEEDDEDEDEDDFIDSAPKSNTKLIAAAVVAVLACGGAAYSLLGSDSDDSFSEMPSAPVVPAHKPVSHVTPTVKQTVPVSPITTTNTANAPLVPLDAKVNSVTSHTTGLIKITPEPKPVTLTQDDLNKLKDEILKSISENNSKMQSEMANAIASSVSDTLNNLYSNQQNQNVIDYNTITQIVDDAIKGIDNSKGTQVITTKLNGISDQISNLAVNNVKNNDLINSVQSGVNALSSTVNNQGSEITKVSKQIRSLRHDVLEPKEDVSSQLVGRTRLANINVTNHTTDGRIAVIKAPSGNTYAFANGEAFTYYGKKMHVSQMLDHGRVLLVGDKFFIDGTRDVKKVQTKPAKKTVKKAKVAKQDYVLLPEDPSTAQVIIPAKQAPKAEMQNNGVLSGWVVNSVFQGGFLISSTDGNTQVVKPGQTITIGNYTAKVNGLNDAKNALQIGNMLIPLQQ